MNNRGDASDDIRREEYASGGRRSPNAQTVESAMDKSFDVQEFKCFDHVRKRVYQGANREPLGEAGFKRFSRKPRIDESEPQLVSFPVYGRGKAWVGCLREPGELRFKRVQVEVRG